MTSMTSCVFLLVGMQKKEKSRCLVKRLVFFFIVLGVHASNLSATIWNDGKKDMEQEIKGRLQSETKAAETTLCAQFFFKLIGSRET